MKSDGWYVVASMYQLKKHPVDMCASVHEVGLLVCRCMYLSVEETPCRYMSRCT